MEILGTLPACNLLLGLSVSQVLVGDGSDLGELSSMTRAALHSLWALVLETIGEADHSR